VIAISPIAFDGLKTTFHEIAHLLLGHSSTALHEEQKLPKDARECEQSSQPTFVRCHWGGDFESGVQPGYIAHWRDSSTLEKIRYGTVFNAADQILKAGRPEPYRPGELASHEASEAASPT
jgi:hypothetical protein